MVNEAYIQNHYKSIATNFGLSGSSTIQDPFIRKSEIEFFISEIRKIKQDQKNDKLSIVDIGCGNGYLLSELSKEFPSFTLHGLEFNPELCQLAKSRELPNAQIIEGSCKDPGALDNILSEPADIIITERVIINLLSWKQQALALRNIASWIKDGGHYLLAESFKEPWFELNAARREMKIPEIPVSNHNRYLNHKLPKYLIELDLTRIETEMPANYLSSHFYLSRVAHSYIKPSGGRKKETHFVNFFDRAIPPAIGNYSPILFYHYIKDKSLGS